MARYSAKLLFQFNDDTASVGNKRRLCEEKTITFKSDSASKAIEHCRKRGKECSYSYQNSKGNRIKFEYIGIIDMVELGIECLSDEVWYDIVTRMRPMERKKTLTRTKKELMKRLE